MAERETSSKYQMAKFDGVWYHKDLIPDEETLESVKGAVLGDDDIMIATYPKSGTAWMLRIATLIRNDADVEKTDAMSLSHWTKFLELEKVPVVRAEPEPRVIKSHVAYEHLPKSFREGKGKIIYVVRNPKDTCVSYHFHHKLFPVDYPEDEPFENFFRRFMEGFVEFGPWSKHVKEYWAHRNDSNVLWLSYEDLHKNTKLRIAEIAKFLGKDFTEEQIELIVKESSFKNMKSKPSLNYCKDQFGDFMDESKSTYYRKGVAGDWKNHLTPEMSKGIDDVVENEITPLGLELEYE